VRDRYAVVYEKKNRAKTGSPPSTVLSAFTAAVDGSLGPKRIHQPSTLLSAFRWPWTQEVWGQTEITSRPYGISAEQIQIVASQWLFITKGAISRQGQGRFCTAAASH
jgi:hypothetical protein